MWVRAFCTLPGSDPAEVYSMAPYTIPTVTAIPTNMDKNVIIGLIYLATKSQLGSESSGEQFNAGSVHVSASGSQSSAAYACGTNPSDNPEPDTTGVPIIVRTIAHTTMYLIFLYISSQNYTRLNGCFASIVKIKYILVVLFVLSIP